MKKIILSFIISSLSIVIQAQSIDTSYIAFSVWAFNPETSLYDDLKDSATSQMQYLKNGDYVFIATKLHPSFDVKSVSFLHMNKKSKVISYIELKNHGDLIVQLDTTRKDFYFYDANDRVVLETNLMVGGDLDSIGYIYYGSTNNIEWKICCKKHNDESSKLISKTQYFYDNLNREIENIKFSFDDDAQVFVPNKRAISNYTGIFTEPTSKYIYSFEVITNEWKQIRQISNKLNNLGNLLRADYALKNNEFNNLCASDNNCISNKHFKIIPCCGFRTQRLSNSIITYSATGLKTREEKTWVDAYGKFSYKNIVEDFEYNSNNKPIYYHSFTESGAGAEDRKKTNMYYRKTATANLPIRLPNLELLIYPSIVQNRLNVSITQNPNTTSTLAIRDVFGSVIKLVENINKPQHSQTLELTALTPGNYTCTIITSDGSSKSQKFIVQK